MYGRKSHMRPSAMGEELPGVEQANANGATKTAATCSAISALATRRATGDQEQSLTSAAADDRDISTSSAQQLPRGKQSGEHRLCRQETKNPCCGRRLQQGLQPASIVQAAQSRACVLPQVGD